MGHAFDDRGSKSDGNSVLRTWWKDQDVARFKALIARLVVQYARYEPLPSVHLDGATTLGENIGDNAGLRIALDVEPQRDRSRRFIGARYVELIRPSLRRDPRRNCAERVTP